MKSFNQGEEAGENNHPALVGQSSIISIFKPLNGLDKHHVTVECNLASQTAPQHRIIEAAVPQQGSDTVETKALYGISSFKETVFDTTTNAPTHWRETSSYRRRTGPMSPNSLANTKSVKDAGGACWRCKFVGKGCDAGDPCSSCPQKATPWHALGCRRGTLSDVLTCVVSCPLAGGQSISTPPNYLKRKISDVKEHETIANLANIYLPQFQRGDSLSLSTLLSSALQYQSTIADVSFVPELATIKMLIE